MLNLHRNSSDEFRGFGQRLMQKYHGSLESFEAAAQVICENIFDEFRGPDGHYQFALFRVFRMGSIDDIPPHINDSLDSDTDEWLTLAGTVGVEHAWCDRFDSMHHQVIPVTDNISPMFKQAFTEMDLSPELTRSVTEYKADSFSNYFLINNVRESNAVPDKDFVHEYGLQSVIGIGGRFLSGATYLALGFSTTPITRIQADKFAELSPFLSTLLAAYDGRGILWER